MKTHTECIPCFVRQAIDGAALACGSEATRQEIVRKALVLISEIDYDQSPPKLARDMHRMVRHVSGNSDPYLKQKELSNAMARELYGDARRTIESSHDRLAMAIRFAIAGNIIDFGIAGSEVNRGALAKAVERAMAMKLDDKAVAEFRDSLRQAKKILYLGDNTGEIFFDRLLLEQLPLEKITFVVKHSAILNDALMADAELAGITGLVRVIDNGSDAPGTILELCSEEFRAVFTSADIIISKGQGNFETLDQPDKEFFFMLKAKCPVVAQHLGCPIGTCIFRHQKAKNV